MPLLRQDDVLPESQTWRGTLQAPCHSSAPSVCQNGERNLLQQKIQLNSTWPFIQSSGIHKLYVLLQNSCRWSKVMIKYCCCLPRSSVFGLWLQRVIKRTKPTLGLFRVFFQLSWEGIREIIWILIKGRFHHREQSLQTAIFFDGMSAKSNSRRSSN